MIERKTTLTMLCDECGNVFTDDSGHAINIMDYYADDLYEIVAEKGWSVGPNPCGCLCPDCKRKGGAE